MSHLSDLYEILGAEVGADEKVLKKAYYAMSQKYHPDTNPGKEAEVMMKKVTDAYDILKDPSRTKEFIEEKKKETKKNIREMEKKKAVAKRRAQKKQSKANKKKKK